MKVRINCINEKNNSSMRISIDSTTTFANLAYYLNSIGLITFDNSPQPFMKWAIECSGFSVDYFQTIEEGGVRDNNEIHFRQKRLITVYCMYEEYKYKVEILEGSNKDDLIQILHKKHGIPVDITIINTNRSPWEPSVRDGEEYSVYRNIDGKSGFPGAGDILYGCPTSKDRMGNVPACMLTTFDGFILSKV